MPKQDKSRFQDPFVASLRLINGRVQAYEQPVTRRARLWTLRQTERRKHLAWVGSAGFNKLPPLLVSHILCHVCLVCTRNKWHQVFFFYCVLRDEGGH